MTDFATLTNAQLNRWAAERDGYSVFYEKPLWFLRQPSGATLIGRPADSPDQAWAIAPKCADRADLAIALLGRWGYRWTRGFSYPAYTPFVVVSNRFTSHRAYESPDCDTARALIIAANSLKESEEG